jgi:hypothetical protein
MLPQENRSVVEPGAQLQLVAGTLLSELSRKIFMQISAEKLAE